MRRLARGLSTLCCLLSLLLCAAACVLWVRSRTISERGSVDVFHGGGRPVDARGRDMLQVESNPGRVTLWWNRYHPGPHSFRFGRPVDFEWRRQLLLRPPARAAGQRPMGPGGRPEGPLGFTVGTIRTSFQTVRFVAFPHWCAVLLLGLWPAIRARRWWRGRRRFAAGQCRACGYDLRATPDRCPECGTIPPGVTA